MSTCAGHIENCTSPKHRHHKQVVADPQPAYRGPEYWDCNDPVQVDAEMHGLLQALWANDFMTQFSCAGWPYVTGANSRGYILFRTAEEAIRFFSETHQRAADRDQFCPHLVLETCEGMSDDMTYLDENLPPRGTIRFGHRDLNLLEELWA